MGAAADTTNSLAKAVSVESEGIEAAETLSKGSLVVAGSLSPCSLYVGYSTNNSNSICEGYYGAVAVGGSIANPLFGVGMAVGGLTAKLSQPAPSAFAQEIANAGPKCQPVGP